MEKYKYESSRQEKNKHLHLEENYRNYIRKHSLRNVLHQLLCIARLWSVMESKALLVFISDFYGMVSLLREYANTNVNSYSFLTVLQNLYCWIFEFEWNVDWIKCSNLCSYYIYLVSAAISTCWIELWITRCLEFCRKVDQNIFLDMSKISESSLLILWKCGVTNCWSLESPYYGPSVFSLGGKLVIMCCTTRVLCELLEQHRVSHSA